MTFGRSCAVSDTPLVFFEQETDVGKFRTVCVTSETSGNGVCVACTECAVFIADYRIGKAVFDGVLGAHPSLGRDKLHKLAAAAACSALKLIGVDNAGGQTVEHGSRVTVVVLIAGGRAARQMYHHLRYRREPNFIAGDHNGRRCRCGDRLHLGNGVHAGRSKQRVHLKARETSPPQEFISSSSASPSGRSLSASRTFFAEKASILNQS